MDHGFLIRMITWEEDKDYPTLICAFCTDKIEEYLKLYEFARKNEIYIDIPDREDIYAKNFADHTALVKENRIVFGTDEGYTTLNVEVEVF